MTGSMDVLVHTLRSVRHGASEIRYRQDAVLAELTSPRAMSVAIATVQLHDAVDSFETAVGHLQAIAAELDCDLGRRMIASLGELVLHLRVFAILSQVEQLVQAIHSADVEICALFTGRLRSIGEVSALVYEQITRMWLDYGHLIRAPGGSIRRDVVREAHRALTLIGSDPDFMYVLRIGMAHPDWPGVFCACANLAELLALTVDLESDAARFQANPALELIDDLPASVRAGIRRDERKR